MRIAVLVYGRLNHCAEHYNNIKDSIGRQNDIDFFMSSDNSDESLLNDFIRYYKPKLYTNSPIHYDYDIEIYPGKRPESNIHRMTCHFINKNRVLSLFEEYIRSTDVQYDIVMSLRIDCVFHNNFVFNKLEENTIYIPSGRDYVDKGINDQIAYGNVDVMRKYNSINLVNLLEQKLSIPHSENLNYANIHLNNLKIERFNLGYYLHR